MAKQYGFKIALESGAEFFVTSDDRAELVEEYEFFGGNGQWLVGKLDEAIPATERGEGVGALSAAITGSLQGTVTDEPEPAADEPESDSERVDPWSGKPAQEPARRRSPSRTAPSRATSAAPSSSGGSGPVEKTDRFGGKWVLGLPDAPLCDHQQPAGLHTWEKRNGGTATAFKCANGAPGGNWKDKCEFFEFPPR